MSAPPSPPPAYHRDWDLRVDLPAEHVERIVQSMMAGTVDLRVASAAPHLLLCAQPKSASLYVCEFLARSLGLANAQVGFDGASGAVYYPRLLATQFWRGPTVSHCHAPPDRKLRKMLEVLDLRPLVLTRNLLDSLVSRRDMLVKDKCASNLLSPDGMALFLNATPSEQLDWMIDLFAPEYMNFRAGWEFLREEGDLRPVFLTYEELVQDEVALVTRVAAELELPVDPDEVRRHGEHLRATGGINLNVGVCGRGAAEIGGAQIERLRILALRLGCWDEAYLGFALG